MFVRKALESDIPRMMEIYALARTFMAEHGNPEQWGADNWPPEYLIRDGVPPRGSAPRLLRERHVLSQVFLAHNTAVFLWHVLHQKRIVVQRAFGNGLLRLRVYRNAR